MATGEKSSFDREVTRKRRLSDMSKLACSDENRCSRVFTHTPSSWLEIYFRHILYFIGKSVDKVLSRNCENPPRQRIHCVIKRAKTQSSQQSKRLETEENWEWS